VGKDSAPRIYMLIDPQCIGSGANRSPSHIRPFR
jgi:hypothetical protein